MARRAALANAALAALSFALALGAAELGLRLFVPLRAVGPSFTVYDAQFGKRLKAGFSAERVTPEFRMRLTTNSLGFRGPEPAGAASRPLLFLGDSFTLGYGVNDGEEYPARVAQALRQRRGADAPPVVNAGLADSGNGYWLKLLRGPAPALQPRLVVMQVFHNDFADNLNEKLFALGADGALRELPVPPPGALRRAQPLLEALPGLERSYLLALLRQARPPEFGGDPTLAARELQRALRPDDALTLRIVEEALALCAVRGWPVLGLLVDLPPAHREAFGALFARHGARVLQAPGRLERPELYYRVDGHWNAAGHEAVAQAVLAELERLLPSAALPR